MKLRLTRLPLGQICGDCVFKLRGCINSAQMLGLPACTGMDNDANHAYLSSDAAVTAMLSQWWQALGNERRARFIRYSLRRTLVREVR